MADQGLSSLTNFALSIIVARSVSASEFGVFGLVFTSYLLVQGTTRALIADPLTIRFSARVDSVQRRGAQQGVSAALTLATVGGLCFALAGWMVDGLLGQSLVAFAIVLPGLMLQDTWRFVFFMKRESQKAFFNDLVWALVQFFLLAGVLLKGTPSVWLLILVWGAAATVAGVVGYVQARLLPSLRPRESIEWFGTQRDLGLPFLGEFGAIQGASKVSMYGLSAIAGLAHLGAVRGGYVLFGPLNVLMLGARLALVPEGVRLRERSVALLARSAGILSSTLALLALSLGLLLMMLPTRMGEALLGETWNNVAPLLLPLTLMKMAMAAASGSNYGLRALGAARETLRIRLIVAPFVLVGGLGGAALGGAVGAVSGLAAAYWIAFVLWSMQFRQVMKLQPRGRLEGIVPDAS